MALISEVLQSISIQELLAIEREAKDYALSQGIAFKLVGNENDNITMKSITMFPSPFPKHHFEFAKKLQPIINEVCHKMAYNYEFISESLANTIQVDDYMAKLFHIYNHVLKEGLAQNTSLGIFRADYMMNQCSDNSFNMKQVEINTCSAAGGGSAPSVQRLHKHIVSKYTDIKDLDSKLPDNESNDHLAKGLIQAFDAYNQSNAVIIVVIEPNVINVFDQRMIEFSVTKFRPDIKIIRLSFADMRETAKLSNNKDLIINNAYEVAVVYYRTGALITDYEGQQDWNVRLMIERSKAIKCQSIQHQLAGCKKIQQIMANKIVLEKFVSNEKDVQYLMQVFTGLWGLELGPTGDSVIDMALKNPKQFVLKPEREGGGNNYFGDEMVVKLNDIKNSKQRESHILMKMINAPVVPNHILCANKSISRNQFEPELIQSEFGVFGVVLSNDGYIVHNTEAGYNMQSKVFGTNEGGIIAGFGALDSPYLY